jgi:protein SCO1
MDLRLNNLAGIAMLTLLAAAGDASAQGGGGSNAEVFDKVGIAAKLGEQVPLDLEFVDSTGHTVRLRDSFGEKPVVLHLVYYDCPMLCKLSADGLFRTLRALSLEPGEDFSIVTLSFDPREKLHLSAAAREMAIEQCGRGPVERGWRFLTGNEEEISAVTEAVGFRYVFDEKTKQYAHAAGVFVLTPEGVVSRYLSGIEYSPRDLRLALVEASDGKVGSVGDQVMLLCYMYDPTRGRYGLAVMTALRAAGVATVGVMATAIFVMIRRERRTSPAPPVR